MRKLICSLFFFVPLAVITGACSDPEAAKQRYLESGNRYFAEERYDEAIVEYRNAVQQDARFGEARWKLAEAYAKTRNVQGAFREYVRAADLLPDDTEVQLTAGGHLLFARRFEDAKSRAEGVLKREPQNLDAILLRANAMAGLKDVEGAITEIEGALELGQTDGRLQTSLGLLRLAQGETSEAEAAFKKALAVDPKSVPARLALANYYWSAGRLPEAEQSLKEALALEPTHYTGNRMLANLYVAMRRPVDSEQPLKVLASAPSGNGRMMLADYYIQMQRPNDAVPLLKQLAADRETEPAASLRLAMIDRMAGRRDTAYRMLESLVGKDPRNAAALTLTSRWQLEDRNPDGALKSALAATQADPGAAPAHFALGRAQTAKSDYENAIKSFNEVLRLNPRAVSAQVELSRVQLAVRDVNAAVQLAQQATKAQPGNPVAQATLARGLIAQGNLARAEPAVRALVQQFPQAAATHAVQGQLLMARNDRSGARAAFQRALERDVNSVDALEGLMMLDVAENNLPTAVMRIESRVTASPNNPALVYLAALTYGAAGQTDKAEQTLRQVIELAPDNMAAYLTLGRLYIAQKKLDAALTEFDEVFERQPSNVAAATMSALILEAQNKTAEAQKRYEVILAENQRAGVAANNLAWLYAENGGNLDIALQLAQTARAQMPSSAEVNDTLGWVYYKKDLAHLAIAPLEESVAKDPKNPAYQYHLGLAYAKAGDSRKAQAALERALQLSSTFSGADVARKTLAELKG